MKYKLYRHFDSNDILLYVGVSKRALQRLCEHETGSHWSEEIVKVTMKEYNSKDEALTAETTAILCERPKYNKRGNPNLMLSDYQLDIINKQSKSVPRQHLWISCYRIHIIDTLRQYGNRTIKFILDEGLIRFALIFNDQKEFIIDYYDQIKAMLTTECLEIKQNCDVFSDSILHFTKKGETEYFENYLSDEINPQTKCKEYTRQDDMIIPVRDVIKQHFSKCSAKCLYYKNLDGHIGESLKGKLYPSDYLLTRNTEKNARWRKNSNHNISWLVDCGLMERPRRGFVRPTNYFWEVCNETDKYYKGLVINGRNAHRKFKKTSNNKGATYDSIKHVKNVLDIHTESYTNPRLTKS